MVNIKEEDLKVLFSADRKGSIRFFISATTCTTLFQRYASSEMKIQQELPAYFKDCCSLHMAMFISCKTAIWMCKWIPGEQQVVLDFPVVFHLLQSPSVSYSFTNCVVEVD
jgi:hypothetical protein